MFVCLNLIVTSGCADCLRVNPSGSTPLAIRLRCSSVVVLLPLLKGRASVPSNEEKVAELKRELLRLRKLYLVPDEFGGKPLKKMKK